MARPIVCATRGGEVSRRTQKRAIALAQERGKVGFYSHLAGNKASEGLARSLGVKWYARSVGYSSSHHSICDCT